MLPEIHHKKILDNVSGITIQHICDCIFYNCFTTLVIVFVFYLIFLPNVQITAWPNRKPHDES